MALNYGTDAIPSDSYSVIEGGTVQIGAAFERSVGLIGGMDTSNGTATPGEAVTVSSSADALSKFGDDSELHRQCELAFANGAVTVYAYPVEETTGETESFSSTSSGTLANIPFNPDIHSEHFPIEATDTAESAEVDVKMRYGSPPAAPSDANTIHLNPVTGEWTADESSSYDITYDYGTYDQAAVDAILDMEPRIVGLMREDQATIQTLETELQDRANDFQFAHGVATGMPFADKSSPDTAGYTDSLDSERLSVALPAFGHTDEAGTNTHRVTGAIAGELASLPLGLSSTNNTLNGIYELRTPLTPTQAGDLIDEQVMPLIEYPPVTIVKDMTTSTTQKFERVYAMQVVDEATEVSHQINRQFLGDQNTKQNRLQLSRSHKNSYNGFKKSSPRLLDDYAVRVSENDTDPKAVDVDIGLDVVDVMDDINVTMVVGDVVNPAEVS